MRVVLAVLVLSAGPAWAAGDYSYGTGSGAYVPGAGVSGGTGYGVGSGAYAPGAGAAPRYGAPGSAGSGFQAPGVLGVPGVPGTLGRAERPAVAGGAREGAAIDTGIARRPPRGGPAAGGTPGSGVGRDPFGR